MQLNRNLDNGGDYTCCNGVESDVFITRFQDILVVILAVYWILYLQTWLAVGLTSGSQCYHPDGYPVPGVGKVVEKKWH